MLTDFPKAKGEEKRCKFINIPKKEKIKWWDKGLLSCVVNDVLLWAGPCWNMAPQSHRQMVSCKIAQLSFVLVFVQCVSQASDWKLAAKTR